MNKVNMIFKTMLFLSILSLFSGCTSDASLDIKRDIAYLDASGEKLETNEELAILRDSVHSHSNWKSYFYTVSYVDGKKLEDSSLRSTSSANDLKGNSMDLKVFSHKLTAGTHRLVINGDTYIPVPANSFGQQKSMRRGVIFNFEGGKTYIVKGALYDGKKDLWIEDSSGKRLTGKLLRIGSKDNDFTVDKYNERNKPIAVKDLTGKYTSKFHSFRIKQVGNKVKGSIGNDRIIEGVVEGNFIIFEYWSQDYASNRYSGEFQVVDNDGTLEGFVSGGVLADYDLILEKNE